MSKSSIPTLAQLPYSYYLAKLASGRMEGPHEAKEAIRRGLARRTYSSTLNLQPGQALVYRSGCYQSYVIEMVQA